MYSLFFFFFYPFLQITRLPLVRILFTQEMQHPRKRMKVNLRDRMKTSLKAMETNLTMWKRKIIPMWSPTLTWRPTLLFLIVFSVSIIFSRSCSARAGEWNPISKYQYPAQRSAASRTSRSVSSPTATTKPAQASA